MIVVSRYRATFHIALLTIWLFSSSCIFAQTDDSNRDPLLLPRDERVTASLPVTWGIIVDVLPPLKAVNSDGQDYTAALRYGVMAYYDTWQLGYSRKQYGSVFSLTARNVSRDAYYGWYVEAGNTANLALSSLNEEENRFMGINKKYELSGALYGLGGVIKTGLSESARIAFLVDGSIDYINYDGDGYFIGGNVDLGIGMRVPINTFAFTIGVNLFVSSLLYIGNEDVRSPERYGAGLYGSFAFNGGYF